MTRTRADALVLVNWNGIFYERFLLDRHVTALEGVNGAGKTTVMIAAYVVLLPDMSRLRFTNLGETGATGGDRGIWGRLGELGRPSYAAIDFTLPGSGRLVAGVHLERKGEPSVEPTPFIVTELGDSIRLQELMLTPEGDRESVPELPELRKNAARLGGRLQVFSTAREYFLALFEHGVTPLRLGTDEERTKLNEMLRTSMTGGISRALTSELRTFLLKEEANLAGTLHRMRANLDACRRTRTEVIESQRLEREIGGVFEAGQTMFAAALLATRARAEEFAHRVEVAEAEREAARAALKEAGDALARIVAEIGTLETRRGEGEAELDRTQTLLARMTEALAAADEVSRRRRELEEAEAVERAAAQGRAAALGHREADRIAVQRARETQKHAAAGLADLSRGLDELYRRAGAHRQTVRRRAEAESLLHLSDLPADGIAARIDGCRTLLAEADLERRDRERDLADAESHREAYERARAALRVLLRGDVPDSEAHGAALGAIRGLRDLRSLAARIPDLARDLAEARALASRQADVRERARNLGVPPGEGPAAEQVRSLLLAAESERSRFEGELRDAQSAFSEAKRTLADLGAQRRQLLELAPRWQDLAARAERLGTFLGGAVPDRPALDQARSLLADRLAAAKAREQELAGDRERLLAEADRLLASGGPFDPDLLRLRDRLGADLLAAGYEDVSLSEAARIEARLGPLAQALLVGDPRAAARAIADRPDSLPSVWLLAGEAGAAAPPDEDPGSHDGSRDVHVLEGPALRVSRIPERPCLGRTAREARVRELRAQADLRDRERDEAGAARRELGRLVEDGEALLGGLETWLAGDPGPRIAETDRRIAETDKRAALHRDAATRNEEAARRLGPRIDGLRGLLADSFLLDPPDHATRAGLLAAEHERAVGARAEVARCGRDGQLVEDSLDTLRRAPLSDPERGEIRRRVEWLRRERDRLQAAIEALDFVGRNLEALSWDDAERKLEQSQALVPALEDQLRRADEALAIAEGAERESEVLCDEATTTWQDADGRRGTARHQLTASEDRFRAFGIAAPTAADEQALRREVADLTEGLQRLGWMLGEMLTDRGRKEAAHRQAGERDTKAEAMVDAERREAAPAIERWKRLEDQASRQGLLASALAVSATGVADIRGGVNLVQEAHKQRAVLIERLRSARGGTELLAEVESGQTDTETLFADSILALWLRVRDWLRRRLPAQVAEVADPREALLRLRDQLASLEERLARQERELRGASEDVARGIDVQIRKARGQVLRLNGSLKGIRFGTIEGIQVRLALIEKMGDVLNALRGGAAQGLLFQENMPIEDALDEILRRHGGGRTGGQRLLDYREYIHLGVEIRRAAGPEWEGANPTRLSTGEAIGVGAALMMVVLTEWERDANLLRGRRSSGSLRFLFLDEANRLSHDNLGVLFDLCQTLDLQLLIAAPEVARAEGNTTYRLVRRPTPDGREEVVVSGRRTRAEA